jgi:hypothetical protein
MGWPILGDSIYGTAPRFGGSGLHLHAREIVVPLYKNRPPIEVTASVPEHMRERLMQCGWDGDSNPSTDNISRPHAEEPAEAQRRRASRSMGPPPPFETRASPAPQGEGGAMSRKRKTQ